MTSERPWAGQPSARSPRRLWQNGALVPSLQVAIIGSLSALAGAAINVSVSAANVNVRVGAGARARARTVAGAQNHRAVTGTIGHPLGFIPHIMALSRRMDTDFLGSAPGSLLPFLTNPSVLMLDALRADGRYVLLSGHCSGTDRADKMIEQTSLDQVALADRFPHVSGRGGAIGRIAACSSVRVTVSDGGGRRSTGRRSNVTACRHSSVTAAHHSNVTAAHHDRAGRRCAFHGATRDGSLVPNLHQMP
jgi:hypothetical protein